MRPFDAIVLADGPSDVVVAGLSLAERARRVCARVGARRIQVVHDAAELASAQVNPEDAALLVVRARDQVVHMPLLQPLLAADGDRRVAVGPPGQDEGAYAGALFAGNPEAAAELLAALADDDRIAAAWLAAGATPAPHGAVARHRAVTPEERKAAARYLERMIHKPQDGPVTRWLYRPVSIPITRLLLRYPITPNQVSYAVAALGVVSVVIAMDASYDRVTLGAAIMLAAGYLDGCDGEIARLKLLSSKLGAWLDTITDELSQLFFMIALGYHNYLRSGDSLWLASIGVGTAAYLIAIGGIYYWLIVVLDSANSQDYVGKTQLERTPSGALIVVPKPPVTRQRELPRWLRAIADFAPHVVRRDFVNWGTLVFAALHINHISYAIMVAGGVVTAAVVVPNHLLLRRNLRAARAGTTTVTA